VARKTRPAILAALATFPGYATAQALHTRLHELGHQVGLATVYRELTRLLSDGIIERSPDGGDARYRQCANASHHHHVECVECGASVDIPCDDLATQLSALAAAQGFRLDHHVIYARGRCAACAERS
jgi:Fur family transcriptional regulator, ferric uptake regulator